MPASALTVAAFSGNYGLNATVIAGAANSIQLPVIGSVAVTNSGTNAAVDGFADFGTGGPDFAVSGSFTTSATGVFVGTLTGLNQSSRSKSDSFSLYPIDSTRAIAIETDPGQLMLGYLQSAATVY